MGEDLNDVSILELRDLEERMASALEFVRDRKVRILLLIIFLF